MGRNGGILSSTAVSVFRLEMSAPFDSLTLSFFTCSVRIQRLPFAVQKLFHAFRKPQNFHMGPKIGGVLVISDPLRPLVVMPPQKALPYTQNASFESLGVQIG